MFAWKTSKWAAADQKGAAALPKLDTRTSGMVAGTKVATRAGWAAIETISSGQEVLTFDGGLQTVIAVTRHVLMADTADVATWPLAVPAGALGNRDAMTILPNQSVMIESDVAEDLTGDPFALIPAAALEGLGGISRMRPSDWVEVIQLHFERDEVVFANIGALFLSPAQVDLACDSAPGAYEVLKLDLAFDLVAALANERFPLEQPAAAHAAA